MSYESQTDAHIDELIEKVRSLEAERDAAKGKVAEAERDEWEGRYNVVAESRDGWRDDAHKLAAERDAARATIAALVDDRRVAEFNYGEACVERDAALSKLAAVREVLAGIPVEGAATIYAIRALNDQAEGKWLLAQQLRAVLGPEQEGK